MQWQFYNIHLEYPLSICVTAWDNAHHLLLLLLNYRSSHYKSNHCLHLTFCLSKYSSSKFPSTNIHRYKTTLLISNVHDLFVSQRQQGPHLFTIPYRLSVWILNFRHVLEHRRSFGGCLALGGAGVEEAVSHWSGKFFKHGHTCVESRVTYRI